MVIECAWCNTVQGEKPGEGEPTSGICDDCLAAHFPKESPKVKAYRVTCGECLDRNLKCEIIACDKLSRILDDVDAELKAQGI